MTGISCPNCKTVLQANAEQAGMTITCPNCQAPINVPKEEAIAQPLAGNAGSPPPMPTVEKWFFNRNGNQEGPVSAEQLRGLITPNDLVWKQGLPQWVHASTIPNLLSIASSPSNTLPPPRSPGSGGNVQPYRGGLILTLGILSFVFPPFSVVVMFEFFNYLALIFVFLSLPLGLIAWILGGSDLSKMSVGTMDRSGEGTTRAGYICGIITTVLEGLALVIFIGILVMEALVRLSR